MNWLDFACRVGTTIAAVAGSAAVGAASGAISGAVGGPIGASSGAIAGAGIGVAGGLAQSGQLCDQAAHDLYMRQKCQALKNGEMYVKLNGKQLATVKTLAEKDLMPPSYYKDIGACEEAGYLPRDSKGMILP